MTLVFPFENDSRVAALDWLGEGLAEITVERLEGRGINVLARADRLNALQGMGVPSTAVISRATMLKVAEQADADHVVFGRFFSDGKNVTIEARVLHTSPPGLSDVFTQASALPNLIDAHARLISRLICSLAAPGCAGGRGPAATESASSPRMETLEIFVQGLVAPEDQTRIRSLREAARLDPAWDRPPFELGQIYFARRECEAALPWLSRVPPNRPGGAESGFKAGICHLLGSDFVRAEAAFAALAQRLPSSPEAYNNLGVARLRQGKWNEAAEEFERASALDSESPDYSLNLGLAKMAAKQPSAALAPLRHVLALQPADKDARSILDSALESLGRSGAPGAAARETPSANSTRPSPAASLEPFALARLARVAMEIDLNAARIEAAPPAPEDAPQRSLPVGGRP